MIRTSIIISYVVISDGLVQPFHTDSYLRALQVLHSQFIVNNENCKGKVVSPPHLEFRILWKPESNFNGIISSLQLSHDLWSLNMSLITNLHDYIVNFKL